MRGYMSVLWRTASSNAGVVSVSPPTVLSNHAYAYRLLVYSVGNSDSFPSNTWVKFTVVTLSPGLDWEADTLVGATNRGFNGYVNRPIFKSCAVVDTSAERSTVLSASFANVNDVTKSFVPELKTVDSYAAECPCVLTATRTAM